LAFFTGPLIVLGKCFGMLCWLKGYDASTGKLCKNMQIWPMHVIKGWELISDHIISCSILRWHRVLEMDTPSWVWWPMFSLLWPEFWLELLSVSLIINPKFYFILF
jgi:hypothetical protein